MGCSCAESMLSFDVVRWGDALRKNERPTPEPRGTVDVKGKGEMEVWLVVSSREKVFEKGA